MLKNLKTSLLIIGLVGFNVLVMADSKPAPAVTNLSSHVIENYLSGKFDPATHPDFVSVPERYANRRGYYLREAAFNAFSKMHAAAHNDNITLTIRSAARNFDHQKRIWNRKWHSKRHAIPDPKNRVKNILKYSSMPGTSRHHWGTELDLNSFDNAWFSAGEGLKLFNWMNANAHKYGFSRPYTAKDQNRPTGYNEEKWHWSYTPLSKPLLNDAQGVLTDNNITGFSGSEYAASLSIVENYIFGVDASCR